MTKSAPATRCASAIVGLLGIGAFLVTVSTVLPSPLSDHLRAQIKSDSYMGVPSFTTQPWGPYVPIRSVMFTGSNPDSAMVTLQYSVSRKQMFFIQYVLTRKDDPTKKSYGQRTSWGEQTLGIQGLTAKFQEAGGPGTFIFEIATCPPGAVYGGQKGIPTTCGPVYTTEMTYVVTAESSSEQSSTQSSSQEQETLCPDACNLTGLCTSTTINDPCATMNPPLTCPDVHNAIIHPPYTAGVWYKGMSTLNRGGSISFVPTCTARPTFLGTDTILKENMRALASATARVTVSTNGIFQYVYIPLGKEVTIYTPPQCTLTYSTKTGLPASCSTLKAGVLDSPILSVQVTQATPQVMDLTLNAWLDSPSIAAFRGPWPMTGRPHAGSITFSAKGFSLPNDGSTYVVGNVEILFPKGVCGDGILDEGEFCDDGKHCANGTPCTATATCAGIGDQLCTTRSGDRCPADCKDSKPLSLGCFMWRKNYNTIDVAGTLVNFDATKHSMELAFNGSTYAEERRTALPISASGKFKTSAKYRFLGNGKYSTCEYYRCSGSLPGPRVIVRDRASRVILLEQYATLDTTQGTGIYATCAGSQ